jgi:hypothetical protein
MCDHKNTKPTEATKKIAGLVFEYSALECMKCGAVLWSSETELLFRKWLNDQKKLNAEKFTIQGIRVSQELKLFAMELAASSFKPESDVYQACLAFYFVYCKDRPDLKEALDGDKFRPVDSKGSTIKLRVSPNMFVKIEANASIFQIPKSHVASFVLQRVLRAAKMGFDATRKQIEFALEA